ncbi:hypothetical protein RhiirA5_414584 [Rhizophagus irregularis]|uniref:Uncharacterized protein n=3 Tax=Rhizophagus irregularis TaxID=588596 RepID=A0A2I1ENC1_9GLOM|nr:hypothetical protein GLOIN_2v1761130 [Rhizophagus irregularis DAOM 181602=DAOM 197198]EXX78487.1 hypothetical protein RirG_014570 [Rhizophagus irregularis DAOM 197198w]PKC10283.1 hypothetical protein RhiirA5_414584 [Rhizophagus irregularis]PKC72504.1 hypothetical protein RhiirA1_452232 [Rhizophagus irregularis]PKK74372.1 hypothetical protein RhiirC2_846888 [Rhizophagus irregularis]PKY23592.1 hypothetical protein RhiirB3_437848 [Rhizophagus irregularis]|eukprot:XP_025189987.1 hypothetical protein GLOIN_2v1761130 [Rhizophagus irregularis DAOM 181602=DAOM 197198]
MNNINPSQNNLGDNNIGFNNYPANLPQTASTNIDYNDATYNNNTAMNNNDNNFSARIPDSNYQPYNASNNNNTTIPPSQSTSNPIFNNSGNIPHQQYATSSNTPHHNYQQPSSTSNPQSNVLPLFNSLGININSFQANLIIIMPVDNSNIQDRLQQILNHSSSTNNSRT